MRASSFRLAFLALIAALAPNLGVVEARPAKKETAKTETGKSSGQGTAVQQFGNWGVFSGQGGKGKICYAATQPTKRAPEGLKRGPAMIFITSRPAEKVSNELSLNLGYPTKGDVILSVGGGNYTLYAKDETVWAKNAADEGKILQAMRAAQSLTIVGTSPRGNKTTDTYALSGFSQALDKMGAECK